MFSCLPSVLPFPLSVPVYQQRLFYPFFFGWSFYCFIFIPVFLFSLFTFWSLMYWVDLTYLAFFSVIASHVALLIHSSFLVLIKNNLCCINIKFTNGFPFFLCDVKHSFCHIWKLIWMLQMKIIPYVFILHFRAINLSWNIFLIFFFFIFMVFLCNWCSYAPSVYEFYHIQKKATWFLVMLSEEIQQFLMYLIFRE